MDKSKSTAKFDAEKVMDACTAFLNDRIKKMNEEFDEGARPEYDEYVKTCNKGIINWIIKVIYRLKYGSDLKTAEIQPMSFEEFKENLFSDKMWQLQREQNRKRGKILYVGDIFTMARNSSGEVYLTAYDAGLLFSKSLESKEGEGGD